VTKKKTKMESVVLKEFEQWAKSNTHTGMDWKQNKNKTARFPNVLGEEEVFTIDTPYLFIQRGIYPGLKRGFIIQQIIVPESMRRQGVCTRLVNHIINVAQEMKLDQVIIEMVQSDEMMAFINNRNDFKHIPNTHNFINKL
jgi:predicted GNAT family acetyltransferase